MARRKDTTKRLCYIRRFLNRPHQQSIGLVLAEASLVTSYDKEGAPSRIDLDAGLTVGDCARSATLDFSLYNASRAEVANIRYKTATLRAAVNTFCDAVEAGCQQYEDARKRGKS